MSDPLNNEDLYVTGIEFVDAQHRQFAALIHRVYQHAKSPVVDETTAELYQELTQYAAFHFKSEENMMRRAGYAENGVHRAEHIKILDELRGRIEGVLAGHSSKAKLVMFLWKWLVEHTNLEDRLMAERLRELGFDFSTEVAPVSIGFALREVPSADEQS